MNLQRKVTVLMPAFNAVNYVGEAVRSVLCQSYDDFDLLIIDDGSTDGTADVVRSFSDPRIHLEIQSKEGIASALNYGLSLTRSTYIARFDADDICFPDRLERQVRFLDTHPDHVMVGCDAEYISENGEHLFQFTCRNHTHEQIVNDLMNTCPVIHSGVMYRREPVLAARGYDGSAWHFEDYLLWVRLLKFGKCANLPEALIRVRINPSSVTIDERWRGRKFRKIKKNIIRRGYVIEKEEAELKMIIRRQESRRVKEGSYHALCGKKFLAENYQPAKARWHVSRAIQASPLRLDNYAMLAVSFLPKEWIRWLHRRMPGKT